jgi:hypothetical protein
MFPVHALAIAAGFYQASGVWGKRISGIGIGVQKDDDLRDECRVPVTFRHI